MGGMTFFLFLVLTVTGVLLMFYYRPTLEYAYTRHHRVCASTCRSASCANMHRWGAHAMVITVWLHMFRVFMTGSYKPPREFNWVDRRHPARADAAALASPATCCRGTSWRSGPITVGTNMARATPFLGHEGPGAQLLRSATSS